MSDFTLYKVSQDFENLVDLIDRDVLEDYEIQELKTRIQAAINSQSQDIVKYYISELADIESLKKEIERLQTIKSAKTVRIEKLKDRLTENMRTLKCPKITSSLGNITLALDSVTESVEVSDDVDFDKIPVDYVKTTKEIRKSEIKKALKNGQTFQGVKIVESPARVVFRLNKESKEHIESGD